MAVQPNRPEAESLSLPSARCIAYHLEGRLAALPFSWAFGRSVLKLYNSSRNTSCDTLRSSFPLFGESISIHLPFQQALEVPKTF
jgi:hypothetical protein